MAPKKINRGGGFSSAALFFPRKKAGELIIHTLHLHTNVEPSCFRFLWQTSGPLRTPTMSTIKRKRRKSRYLLPSSTRPPQLRLTKHLHPLPSSAGRRLIRAHHTLHKQLTAATSRQDSNAVDILRSQLASLGGLERYQDASLAGQSKERGGDTSGVLVQWLTSACGGPSGLSLLEVGALSVENACARSKIFGGGIERIDLNSRHPDIREEDFMDLPLPKGEKEFFDVVSLSLVVNYVGDPESRGNMLARVADFLRSRPERKQRVDQIKTEESDGLPEGKHEDIGGKAEDIFPALFLVLPAPCVNNSRYLDEERLKAILETLGFSLIRRKLSSKLIYYLWRHADPEGREGKGKSNAVFKKQEIRKGKDRNNFAIVLA